MKEFCDHVDHVSVASDGPLRDWERLSPSLHLAGASDVGRWKNVASELHRRGYSDDELKKIFRLNLVTLFKQVLKS